MNLCNLFAVALIALLPSVLSQKLTITSPGTNAVVKTGATTNIVLNFESTTSSVKQVACTLGLRPVGAGNTVYVGTLVFGESGPKFEGNTYTWKVTLPNANKFGKGIGQRYHLTLSQFYLIGATSTPTISEFASDVTVQ
ncbi:uncharacterized protein MELLADRAFT_103542 [Melampsora larici-populina 98AG31]|uniref:Secreted protein n=1 Tax=Melampsora larici-populina (strain 98AG31 / pathotype 3-4-7) TaxID=747676 RepID=F4RBP1_MELLP|nr:uncharacterized protein MELLADRAFT_103542 [Melampsora larici-populina 98AG31]EGG10133.1 secreted protein [Melampsora larici-populina 98AG31]